MLTELILILLLALSKIFLLNTTWHFHDGMQVIFYSLLSDVSFHNQGACFKLCWQEEKATLCYT